MIPDRISAKIQTDETGCWLWTGCLNSKGYGMVRLGRRAVYVHRLVYELSGGTIPPGLQLDHLCRTRRCCNPAHLEPVSHRENLARGHGFKLTDAQAADVVRRRDAGATPAELSRIYPHVSPSHLSRVSRGIRSGHAA